MIHVVLEANHIANHIVNLKNHAVLEVVQTITMTVMIVLAEDQNLIEDQDLVHLEDIN